MSGEMTIDVALKLGVEAQKRGMTQEAEAFYHKVLEVEPENADAYHLLGTLAYDIQDYATAKDLILHAIDLDSTIPVFYNNLGNVFTDLEQLNAARECFEEAINLRNDYPEAHFNLANLLYELGDKTRAEAEYVATLEMDELFPEAYNNLGSVYKEKGHFDKAIECYEKALVLAPNLESAIKNLSEALFQKGQSLQEKQEYREAIYYYQQSLAIDPEQDYSQSGLSECYQLLGEDQNAIHNYRKSLEENPKQAEAHYNLALIFKKNARLQEAITEFKEALHINPQYVDAAYNLANTLKERGEHQQAMEHYARALEIDDKFYPAYVNLAICLNGLGLFDEALKSIEKAEQINATDFEVFNNKGLILHNLHKIADAIKAYEKALSLSPNNKHILWNLSLALLADGNFEKGWELYEIRWELPEQLFNVRNEFSFPQWTGQDLQGKRILVTSEQGLGDSIQFVRLCASLKERGAHVTVKVPESLGKLMKTVSGIDEVTTRAFFLGGFDYHCPMLSLPHALGLGLKDIPDIVPYMNADAEKISSWKTRLSGDSKLKVGIAWAGNPRKHDIENHLLDRRRSISLKQLQPLTLMPDITLYSLQKGDASVQLLTESCGRNIKDYSFEFDNFADTAAFIANLDLVITVDTSVAHLAGAMNIPVWLLSRYDACWRWMIEQETSPWYPSMRIFNQHSPGAWNLTVNDVVNALQEQLAG